MWRLILLKQTFYTFSLGMLKHTCSLVGLATRTLLRKVVVFLLVFYKTFVSFFFTGSCRFVPSCSSYAREAVERHGTIHGLWLAILRLVRCQPFCRGGFDPVPTLRGERTLTPSSHASRELMRKV